MNLYCNTIEGNLARAETVLTQNLFLSNLHAADAVSGLEKTPNRQDPLPDILAYLAPKEYSCGIISL